ncbi:hypothetical protein B0I35DRAFT_53314 [Stachybotrys elegans]|uniref:Flavin-nucleotide-binding protein n=1 Tax=Stachybotrys elegans TaxID=80388 RepID=A0A8K0SMD1_9HYPO|nr:hypothetical protein B0I35DRAFT_53314 [Stachybotrys elegans]
MPHHTLQYPKNAANTVRRIGERGNYELEKIHGIVNSSLLLHVSFNPPDSPFPVTLPMIGQMGAFSRPSADIGDPMDLYIHGYVSSRIMNLTRNGVEEGMPVCVAASHVDGIVLALSAFSHSYNYRSAVLFGYATLVEDDAEKDYAMELITNSVVPDRWSHTRLPPRKSEMQSTSILKVKITSGSAKIRAEGAHDDKHDMENKETVSSIWTGVLPIHQTIGEAIPSSYNAVELPTHISQFTSDFNAEGKAYSTDVAKKP